MSSRSYLSIGDVLGLLQQEFPDVTISKIRFLESQGLVNPERTPSGYRKFYDDDVDRLRWVLRQQREHFLPLKVIKGRLDARHLDYVEPATLDLGFAPERPDAPHAGLAQAPGTEAVTKIEAPGVVSLPWTVAGVASPSGPAPASPGASADAAGPGAQHRLEPRHKPSEGGAQCADGAPGAIWAAEAPARGGGPQGDLGATDGQAASAPARMSDMAEASGRAMPGPNAAPRAPAAPGVGPEGQLARGADEPSGARPPRTATTSQTGRSPAAVRPTPALRATGARGARSTLEASALGASSSPPGQGLGTVGTTPSELMAISGLDEAAIAELVAYGLVRGRVMGDTVYYDEDEVSVAIAVAGFARFGVEVRHLRMHKNAAEREAGFIEQIVLPLVKQRNPEARQRAADTVTELGELGQRLRSALLSRLLRERFG